jgi:hypothetical protein
MSSTESVDEQAEYMWLYNLLQAHNQTVGGDSCLIALQMQRQLMFWAPNPTCLRLGTQTACRRGIRSILHRRSSLDSITTTTSSVNCYRSISYTVSSAPTAATAQPSSYLPAAA